MSDTSADGLFEKFQEFLPDPPPWIDFDHPEFPEYFQIIVLDENGNPKTWWQRVPEHLRSEFP